uniref:Uncharacterized protein n=1 Tax=Ananas comosus var. bracteatus TaxID=296719 RepID=A0A6V7PUC8_ANACO|nr:unnamed protein product [Ananas comosus var. bracteatus]
MAHRQPRQRRCDGASATMVELHPPVLSQPVRGGTMSSSEAAVVDVVPEPRATKRGKSKEPWTLARESVLLDDCVGVLEDSAARAKERYSDLSQHVGMLEKGFHLMEKDIVAAMATFRHRLEQFKVTLARRNDERDVRDVLLQDIDAQVKEVEDLKTGEALPERTEGDQGEPSKASEAKAQA